MILKFLIVVSIMIPVGLIYILIKDYINEKKMDSRRNKSSD